LTFPLEFPQRPNVIQGYENNPEANAASFTNGWFRTGDHGFLDADGYLTLVARIKELIIRGGEKIAPLEVGNVLRMHSAVVEAVAFGVPHRVWGEEVAAVVVLRQHVTASEAELLSHCRDHLADFKCPKKVHFVTTIPRTRAADSTDHDGDRSRGIAARNRAGRWSSRPSSARCWN
jgi:acyl-CoA synthetase (AMP-forming)/AMP-acid ligase II